MTELEEKELAKSWLREMAEPLAGLLIAAVGEFIPEFGHGQEKTMTASAQLMANQAAAQAGVASGPRVRCLFKAAVLFGYGLARYDIAQEHVRSGVVSYCMLGAAKLSELMDEAPDTLTLDEDVLFDVVVERLSAYVGLEGAGYLNLKTKWAIIFGYVVAVRDSS